MSDAPKPKPVVVNLSALYEPVYGIGAERLVQRWLAFEQQLVALGHGNDRVRSPVTGMRRQLQEAAGLVVDPGTLIDEDAAVVNMMVRLTEICLQVATQQLSSGAARELLRNEGFPPKVWRKVFVVLDTGEDDTKFDRLLQASAKDGTMQKLHDDLAQEPGDLRTLEATLDQLDWDAGPETIMINFKNPAGAWIAKTIPPNWRLYARTVSDAADMVLDYIQKAQSCNQWNISLFGDPLLHTISKLELMNSIIEHGSIPSSDPPANP